MALRKTGFGDNWIITSVGAGNKIGNGATTIIALVFLPTANDDAGFFSAWDSTDDAIWDLYIDNPSGTTSDRLYGYNDFTGLTPSGGWTNNAWVWVALTKPAGSSQYRGHKAQYATSGSLTWQHAAYGGNVAFDGSDPVEFHIGQAYTGGTGRLNGAMLAAMAVWEEVLSDADIEAICLRSAQAIYDRGPTAFWTFPQQGSATIPPLEDLSGNGADETDRYFDPGFDFNLDQQGADPGSYNFDVTPTTPPTFVADYQNTAAQTSATDFTINNVAVQVDDRIVCWLMCENGDNGNVGTQTPSMTGVTWTQVVQQGALSSGDAYLEMWTGTATSAGTYTLTISRNQSGLSYFQIGCSVWRDSDGFGVNTEEIDTSGAPSLDITTTEPHSALMGANSDWNAVDGASRVWRTINGITPTAGNGGEESYARNGSFAGFYTAHYTDVGPVGVKAFGLSSPGGQDAAIGVIEILGTAGGAAGPNEGTAGVALAIDVASSGARASRGTSAPTLAIDPAATGARASRGTSAPTLSIDVAATGVAPARGSANVALAVDLAASGARQSASQVDVGISLDLAAAGRYDAEGAADVGLAIDVASAGARISLGSADVGIAIDVAAAGNAPSEDAEGSADLGLAIDIAAVGSAPARGTANFELAVDLAAAGRVDAEGSANVGLAIDVAATGDAPAVGASEGTANVGISIDVAVTGQAPARGSAAVAISIDPAATGVRPSRGTAALLLDIDVIAYGVDPSAVAPIARLLMLAPDYGVGLRAGYLVGLEVEYEVRLTWTPS